MSPIFNFFEFDKVELEIIYRLKHPYSFEIGREG